MTTMKIAKSRTHLLAALACSAALSAQAAETRSFGCPPGAETQRQGASLCLPGKTLTLEYRQKARKVNISVNGHPHTVERIDRNYGPELIGMEKYMRVGAPALPVAQRRPFQLRCSQ
jgi:hypothetical protein